MKRETEKKVKQKKEFISVVLSKHFDNFDEKVYRVSALYLYYILFYHFNSRPTEIKLPKIFFSFQIMLTKAISRLEAPSDSVSNKKKKMRLM